MATALPERAAEDQSRPADPWDRLPDSGNPTWRARQIDAAQAKDSREDVPLAPDIITAIVNGKNPPQLTAKKLMRLALEIPVDWTAQRKLLGSHAR